MVSLPNRQPDATDDDRLRLIVTQISDGILVINQEGVVRYVNPAASTLLGLTADTLIGQPFGFPLTAGSATEIEVRHQANDYRVVEMRAVPTVWADEPVYVVALHDVTLYRRTEAVLRDADAFNWAILNALNNHLAVLDHTGTIIAVNDAWRRFARANGDPDLRYTDVGANYFAVCHTSDTNEVLRGMQAVLAGEQAAFFTEYPCHSPDEERWYEMRAVPLRGANQVGLVVSHTEITSQKAAARVAAEAQALRDRLAAQERELEALRRLAQIEHGGAEGHEQRSLCQRLPAIYTYGVSAYGTLLDSALQQRAFGTVRDPQISAVLLAAQLGAYTATPRDVVEIHLEALRERTRHTVPARAQAYLEEARVLALEVMGHLAGYYRGRTLDNGERGAS
jgi:PAS domain-containing protein